MALDTKIEIEVLDLDFGLDGVSNDPWKAPGKTARTLDEMRAIVVDNIDKSIDALNQPVFQKTPMIRKRRSGYQARIGYSKGFKLSRPKELENRDVALAYLEAAKTHTENGGFDRGLDDVLRELRRRAAKGAATREANKKQLENAKPQLAVA